MVKPLADEKPRRLSGMPPDEDEDRMTKDLAEDAVWKKMQQNTFTRYFVPKIYSSKKKKIFFKL